MWSCLILGAFIAIPLMIELTRSSMNSIERDTASGQFAQLSQGITHYEWFGPKRGPIVVCIHGLTTPSIVWGSLSKGLALMGCRVLTYDLYGHGYSDRPRGKQNEAFFTQQLNDLLRHEDITGTISIVGYSMGGAIASAFAATQPERIGQLILLAPAGMEIVSGKLVKFIVGTPIIGDWLMLAFYPNKLRKGIQAERKLRTHVPRISDQQERELRNRGFVPAVLSSLRGLLNKSQQEQHNAIHHAGLPVLAIWGRDDAVIPLTAADTLTSWSPSTVQVIVDDAGHGLPYTHATQVLEIIRKAMSAQS
jgi:pimeloyl-ACP methyl ester carboxylesterase